MSFIAGYLLGLESAEQGQISPLVVTKNGSYKADRDIDGFNPVTVDVPIVSKTITKNGTYYAAKDGAEGFDPVYVDVPDRYNEGVQDTLNAINGNGSISADEDSLDDTIKGFAMASGDIEVNSTTTGQYAELVFYKYTHEELGSDWWVMGWSVFDSQTGEKISSNCGEIPAAWGYTPTLVNVWHEYTDDGYIKLYAQFNWVINGFTSSCALPYSSETQWYINKKG